MTMPVLNALRVMRPGLNLTVRTAVAAEWIGERLDGHFDHIAQADFGMAMAGALRVLPEESLAGYVSRHADWPGAVEAAAEQLAALRPTALLSNVTYLSLAAAKRIGVPAIAFGPLNWADIFRHYCGALTGASNIWTQMAEAYAAAEVFLQTEPFMPMPSIRNGRRVGPVARIGTDRRGELRRSLGVGDDIKLVLMSLGGIPTSFPFADWPRLAGIKVLAGAGNTFAHPDVVPTAAVPFSFIDLEASCDAVITKPGYGMITEAACNGMPVLLLPRADWPESAVLAAWLGNHGRVAALAEDALARGDFAEQVHRICALEAPPRPAPTGIAEIAQCVAGYLGR
jgi:hypothetical protein